MPRYCLGCTVGDMSANARPVVLTVHGTFAGVADERSPHWWQVDGQLAADLKARFPPDGIVVEPFLWKDGEETGPNRESERQRAGRLLFERVQEFERAGTPYHLVGHSHGGSVIWHALKYSAARNQRLKHLKSWTSVSTPYLELGPDGSIWRRIAAALAVVAALYWMGIWELVPKVISTVRQGGLAGLTTSIPLIEDLPDIRTALGDPAFFALIAAFGVIALLFTLWLVLPFGDLFRHAVISPGSRRFESKAAEWYEPLWLGLAHPQDEAIAGLKATLIRAPELVIRRKHGPFGFLLDFFQPTARPIDQFAWSTLVRKAQGCDIRRTVIRRVAAAPESFRNDVAPLPPKVIAEIEACADEVAARVLARFRDRLQTLSDQADLAALSGVLAGTYDDDSLIHTTMFENHSVRAAIVDWIMSPGAASSRSPVRNVVARHAQRTVALAVAKAIAAVGVVAIVTVIAGQGYQIYYAESRLAAAERIMARFDEPAFSALRDGDDAGRALVRVVRLGIPFERTFAAAAKLQDEDARSEAFQLLMRELVLKNGADELLRWVRSPPARDKPIEPHRMANQLALGLPAALNVLAQAGRPPSPAVVGLLEVASIQINASLKGERRREVYRNLIPTALALGQPALAITWAGFVFEGNPQCKSGNMIENAAAAVTNLAGIDVLEQIIRKCNPRIGAEDRQRMLRRWAVGGLRSCALAAPLLSQASVNRAGPNEWVPPLFIECLVRAGRSEDALRLSDAAKSSGIVATAGQNYFWLMAQALRNVGLISEADKWVKKALKTLDHSNDLDTEREPGSLFPDDALTLEILRVTDLGLHAAFLRKIVAEGEAFKDSRQFPEIRARLRQIHIENFERSRVGACAVPTIDLIDFGTIVSLLKSHQDKYPTSFLTHMLSIADRCDFAFGEAHYKEMFNVISGNGNVEKRANALAMLAAIRSTLRTGLTSAEAAGLPAAILKGYVAAVDRHRPSVRDEPNIRFNPLRVGHLDDR